MQGTVVMLMALSGLGCHHKACDTVYAPSACYSSCYSSYDFGGCYSSTGFGCYGGDIVGSCYSSCYSSSCYSSSCYSDLSCYSSCYSSCFSSCYSAKRKGCCIGRLFSGLFHNHKWHKYSGYNAYASDDYVASAPFYTGYSGLPVFGANVPVYSSGQVVESVSPVVTPAPAVTNDATPPPPAPAATAPKVEDTVPTPPTPAPVTPPATLKPKA